MVTVVTGDSLEEVLIFRDRQTLHHYITPCYKQFLLGLEEPEKSADAEKSEILR